MTVESPGATPEEKQSPSPEDKTADVVTLKKSEFDTLKGANDWAQGRVRALERELEEAKKKAPEPDSKGKKGGEDSETLKLAEAKINELTAQLQSVQTENKRNLLKGKVLPEASKHLLEGKALDDFWTLYGDSFDIGDDGQVFLKSEPWRKDLAGYFAEFSKQHPHFAKNPLRGGDGVTSPSNGGGAAKTLPANWAGLSPTEKTEWMKNLSPQERAEVGKALGIRS